MKQVDLLIERLRGDMSTRMEDQDIVDILEVLETIKEHAKVMDQDKFVLTESEMEEIVEKAKDYLVKEGYDGFVTKEEPHANFLEVDDIPGFITDLQAEEIIPTSLSDMSIQYTVDNNESDYEDMDTKFIVFDGREVKKVIPFDQVIRNRGVRYVGLTEEGFRLILSANSRLS